MCVSIVIWHMSKYFIKADANSELLAPTPFKKNL